MSPAYTHTSKESIQNTNEGAAKEAAKLGREALGNVGDVSDTKSSDLRISFTSSCTRRTIWFVGNP
jgi:hypothetical protein